MTASAPFRLTDVVRDHAREHGDRVALAAGDDRLTYAELEERSARVAGGLRDLGLGEGGRVVWIGKNAIPFFELLFGAAAVRAAVAPLNLRLTPAELIDLTEDAEAGLVVLGPEFAGLREKLGDRKVLVVGEDYEGWVDGLTERVEPSSDATDDDAVLQLYTSGTTGRAKGVLLSHRNFAALLSVGGHWGFDDDSVGLCAMPLFHIGGSGFALVCLAFGARTVLVADIVPDQLLDTMERERVSNAFLVPAVLQMLCAVPGAADRDWSRLRAVAYGASPITGAVLNRVLETFKAPLFQVYGATETTGAITQLDPEDHDPDGPRAHLMRSAGKAYPWVELKVVVDEQAVGPNEIGEVYIRSAQVTAGYWRRPEETEKALTADGWLRTGDGGYLDDEGYLFLTDRIKDMIVTGAENVYPIEVENVVAQHPAVADVAVIGVPHEKWGEEVKAVVVANEGQSIDPDELVAWTRERIAGFKRPRSVDVVDALPRNATGKILKKDLRAQYGGQGS
ncbi:MULTISPECIES: long-chain-fatty-acid--CoA ligase [Actinomycetospora]|uniref:long-chain-fatty-acid--CoA ligase n=1 Tax=Actinomycetospora TaxID=402649 RepID=UPI001E32F7AE|nr:long-chain-fatty-acid--CoA ligase [Actinomycetospora soli]MCD2189506.1 long-chain-fatty-acid--CoA ligase [Actinomycetospora soli]